MACDNSFHGRTMGALSVTGNAAKREPFEPLPGPVTFVDYGDIPGLRAVVDDTTAAVFVEPTLGEGGIVPAPAGFLAAAREICDASGALLVIDEVQSGIGRTGPLVRQPGRRGPSGRAHAGQGSRRRHADRCLPRCRCGR